MSTYTDASFIISASGGYKEGDATPTAGKLYNLKPDGATFPAMDVTGGGNAVSQNSDGTWQINWPVNTPRFKWNDGVPAVLVEGQRQNLITYPRSFDDVSWILEGVAIDDNSGAGYPCFFVDSDGINTNEAYKLTESEVNSYHNIAKGALPIGGFILSVYAKKAERNLLYISTHRSTSVQNRGAYFNLHTGEVIFSGYGIVAEITEQVNGWFRCSIDVTNAQSVSSIFTVGILNDSGNLVYEGDGTSGIYICHAQFEQASSASSASSPIYATEGSVLTRLADNIQVDLPAGVTEVELTDSDDVVTTDSSPADPYIIPVGIWKTLIMKP